MTSRGRPAAPTPVPDVPPPGRRFGEEGGLLTYGGYLRLDELLAQQVPQADPPAHDELLFITVHQVYELWFKQLLYELEAAGTRCSTGETWWARHLLRRVHAIERLLVAQVDILETMTPQDFLEFRATLAPASGFQSVQFRELEFLSGVKDPRFLGRFRSLSDAERARLGRRLAEPSLWDAYLQLLASRGLAGRRRRADPGIAASSSPGTAPPTTTCGSLPRTCSLMTSWPGLWRARHVVMVERQIGTKSGTGRLDRCALPAQTGAVAVLPTAVGAAGPPVAAGPGRDHEDTAATGWRGSRKMLESTDEEKQSLLAAAALAVAASGATRPTSAIRSVPGCLLPARGRRRTCSAAGADTRRRGRGRARRAGAPRPQGRADRASPARR